MAEPAFNLKRLRVSQSDRQAPARYAEGLFDAATTREQDERHDQRDALKRSSRRLRLRTRAHTARCRWDDTGGGLGVPGTWRMACAARARLQVKHGMACRTQARVDDVRPRTRIWCAHGRH